ncbi:hypothetical protein GGR95_003840 [Sulfitobacter undariae]|uniref:Uncharacterized protein n=1 Tax=Sulfitobacter undariae TaxID=1563671 RepID=A0A7W6H2J9_9RHOB|nr:hypothetical protein [Sulfitobacter undariae]
MELRQIGGIDAPLTFVSTPSWQPPLHGSVLAQYTADTMLRDFKLTTNVIDAGTPM